MKNLIIKYGYVVGKIKNINGIKEFLSKVRPLNSEHELIRIGGEKDGGYLIPNDLKLIKGCFSPGVSNIATFEEELSKLGIESYMADYSVDGPPHYNPSFKFIKKFLGSTNSDVFIRLEDWMQSERIENDLDYILQMDIEGAEYRVILDTPLAILERFRIISIEFHNLHKLFDPVAYELIDMCFEKLLKNFYIVHIHPNNCAKIVKIKDIEIPPVVEVTFIRKDRVKKVEYSNSYPHVLDKKCVNELPEIELPKCWYR